MFFQTINRMITAGTDLSINIRQVNDKLTVAVMPRRAGLKDEAGEQIVPLVLNGTPEELDMEFLGAIPAPVQKAQVIQPVAAPPVPGHAPRYQGGEQIRMFAPEQPSRQSPHQIPRSVQGTRPQQVPHGQAASRPGADGIPAGCQQPVNRPQTIQFYQPVQMPQSQVYDGQWLQPVPSQPQTASTQTVPDNKGESEYGARAQDMGQYGFDKDDEHDRELLREDPYAEYLDFPEEYRMKDEAQMEMICC